MIAARLATPGIERPTATVSTRRSGSSRTARTIRSSRTSRSSVAFSRTPGTKLAVMTTKSKTFQPLRKNSRGRSANAAMRRASSTTKSPRMTPLARCSSRPIAASIEA